MGHYLKDISYVPLRRAEIPVNYYVLVGKEGETMEDSEWVKWNQHYDLVQWNAITVFTGVVALLLGYAYTTINLSAFYFLVGWWFTNFLVYYTASFREFRRDLLLRMTDRELCHFLTNMSRRRILRQWPMFLFTFALIDAIWLFRYSQFGGIHRCIAVALAVATAVFLLYARYRGRGVKFDETIPGKMGDP
jgi:hypothetical protein